MKENKKVLKINFTMYKLFDDIMRQKIMKL